MNCYICDKTADPEILHYGRAVAVGICHQCGVGVCAQHSQKSTQPGAPLLCVECAAHAGELLTMPRMAAKQQAG